MKDEVDPAYLRRLEMAFRSIKPKHQKLIHLRQLDGLSYSKIAERLGTSVEQVERRMAQAIFALDRAMEEAEPPWWRFW